MSIEEFAFNGTALIGQLKCALAGLDPSYDAEKRAYSQAKARLPDSAFADALEDRFSAKLLYVAWQGACWNLECCRNPESKLRLQADYEELHGENYFPALPQVQSADKAACAAFRQLTPEQREAAMQIQDFYAYLETVGFKLIHYWGFQWGDAFFPKVVPGYMPDARFTSAYTHMLERDLDMLLTPPA